MGLISRVSSRTYSCQTYTMAFSFNSAATTNNSKLPEQKFPNNLRPIEIPGAPDDTVSALKFSPQVENDGGNHFMATSWAGDVRLWKLHADGKSEPLSQQKPNSHFYVVVGL